MLIPSSLVSLQGADPNCKSKNGLPALHLAAKNKHIDCIHVLVQAGADIDAKGPSSVLVLKTALGR